jgi:hypothetical protein
MLRTVVSSRMPGGLVSKTLYCLVDPSAISRKVSDTYTSGSAPLGLSHSCRRLLSCAAAFGNGGQGGEAR